MKKLLIATDSFLPRWDGVSRFLLEIVPDLKSEYDITIIAPDFKGDYSPDLGVNVVRIPLSMFRVGDYNFAKHKSRKIKKLVSDADIIFAQTVGPIGWLSILYAARMKKPVASFVHSIDWDLVTMSISRKYLNHLILNIMKIFCRWLYSKSDVLLMPSKEAGRLFSKEGIGTRQEFVYLGVDTEKFVPAVDKAKVKEELGFAPDSLVFGFHGRVGREKGVQLLIETFEKVSKEHPESVLLVVGCGVKYLEEKLKSMPKAKHIRYAQDVVKFLQAIDIYVLPSYTETTSLSTLEAMSCGCAVIASRVGLVKRYIRDKYNGLLFNPGNETVLKIKMKWLAENRDAIDELGKKARMTVEDRFEWKTTVDGVKRALRRIESE